MKMKYTLAALGSSLLFAAAAAHAQDAHREIFPTWDGSVLNMRSLRVGPDGGYRNVKVRIGAMRLAWFGGCKRVSYGQSGYGNAFLDWPVQYKQDYDGFPHWLEIQNVVVGDEICGPVSVILDSFEVLSVQSAWSFACLAAHLTDARFDAIQPGMTLTQVEDLLQCPGRVRYYQPDQAGGYWRFEFTAVDQWRKIGVFVDANTARVRTFGYYKTNALD